MYHKEVGGKRQGVTRTWICPAYADHTPPENSFVTETVNKSCVARARCLATGRTEKRTNVRKKKKKTGPFLTNLTSRLT